MAMAGPAAADGFTPDYTALFRDHMDDVEEPSPGLEILELPGPVIVTRRDGSGVRAEDQSGHGPAGCALARLVEITAAVQLCPELLSLAERDRLASLLLRAAAFAGDNTYPPLTLEEREDALAAALAKARLAQGGSCPLPETEADWVRFARSLATDEAARRFAHIFAVPRLPVAQPCP
ncbi:hypothetical protein IQ782_15815 [Salipiger pacificus]|uniref:Uncharacterized protein n=1 Tax=Salipiger mangrovisoli TaxID=2865933 RepID=A0ABR9X4F7_9RHOB|nr:hypothetical protein [Salipiger mangrovisoli]